MFRCQTEMWVCLTTQWSVGLCHLLVSLGNMTVAVKVRQDEKSAEENENDNVKSTSSGTELLHCSSSVVLE